MFAFHKNDDDNIDGDDDDDGDDIDDGGDADSKYLASIALPAM